MHSEKMTERCGKPPLVYAVVLNYNGLEHLQYCVPSLLDTQYDNFALVVVDNASTDSSVLWLRENYPAVDIIVSDKNRGWSGGNNLGITYTLERGAEYVFVANNDIRVDPRWARVALTVAREDERIGLIGFRVFGWGTRGDSEAFRKASAEWRSIELTETTNIPGCAMFVSRHVFEAIGLFDEGFFAYGEENDFQLRAQRAGFRMVEVNIPVWHYSEGSFGKIPLQAARLAMRAEIRLALKHNSLFRVLRKILSMANIACNPILTLDLEHAPTRRKRPSNPIVNGVLLIDAILWNLWRLPSTLERRWIDIDAADRARMWLWEST